MSGWQKPEVVHPGSARHTCATYAFSGAGPFRDGDLSSFSVGDANARYIACMRGINVAAVAGIAVATVLTAPAVLVGASSAHADTGVDGYVSCVGGDAKPPPPEVSAVNWFPSLYVIDTDIASGVPAELPQLDLLASQVEFRLAVVCDLRQTRHVGLRHQITVFL